MTASLKSFSLFLLAGFAAVAFLGADVHAAVVLMHRYSFNDNTANDSVGGANGTLFNGATVSGGALQLADLSQSGSGVEYMQMPAGILPGTSTTVEEWFTSPGSGGWARGFDFGNGPGVNFFFSPHSGFFDDSRVIVNNGAGETGPTGASTLDNGTQHMIAAVVDGTGDSISYYIDGSLIGSTALSPNTLAGVDDMANYLGRSQYNDPGFVGSIDEFRIYSGAASASLIAADFAFGPNALVPEPSSLIALNGIGAMGLLLFVRRRRGSRNANRG